MTAARETKPRERGILFSSPMVKALLAGTKTQTRRIVKDPPRHWSEHLYFIEGGGERWEPTGYTQIRPSHDGRFIWGVYPIGNTEPARPSPYGVPGDRLWVRETWGFDSGVRGGFKPLGRHDLSGMDLLTHTLYRADVTSLAPKPPRWRPAIHMPRWASRITLEIEDVRAERLHDITEQDALAEGFRPVPGAGSPLYPSGRAARSSSTAREEFQRLWESLNGKKAPWASNPWLWVLTFKRITQQGAVK